MALRQHQEGIVGFEMHPFHALWADALIDYYETKCLLVEFQLALNVINFDNWNDTIEFHVGSLQLK
jgi:hypothetical protein